MPEPNKDEEHDDFIKRCIPVVIDDGTAESPEQAVAICNGIWDKAKEGKSTVPKHKSSTALEFASPIPIAEFKADGDDWEVSGYVSIFNNVDMGRDIVRPGAFTKSLQSGRKVRFLYSHDPRAVLGVPKELKEDNKGLFGRFKISKTRLGEETHQLLKDGAIDSFSFGYSALDYSFNNDDTRELKAIEIHEASLVAMPMNPDAIVTHFKEYLTLASKTSTITSELSTLMNDLRGLTDKSRPLSEKKRQELMELLETFSGLDAVRSELQSILSAAPSSLVNSHRIKYQLAEIRKRHPDLFKE
jgi:HK97 family phage prohead protease